MYHPDKMEQFGGRRKKQAEEALYEQEKSITQLMQINGLNKYLYRGVSQQFNEIYKLIDIYAK
jgi:hypothetical protein